MKTPLLKPYGPSIQLFVFFGIVFVSLFLFSFAASLISESFFGIRILDSTQMSDYSNPMVVQAQRMLMVVNQIGFFLVPALVFSRLAAQRGEHFLQLNVFPSALSVFLLLIITLSSQAPINFMLELNRQADLPASLVEMEKNAESIVELMLGGGSNSDLFISLLIFALLPAFAEEVFFRGVIQQKFQEAFRNKHLAIWTTAFVFSFIHMQFMGFLPRFVLGAVLGYVFVWTGSLFSSILLHFFNNALGVVLMILLKRGSIDAAVEKQGAMEGQWPYLILSSVIMISALWYLNRIQMNKRNTILNQ